MLSRDKVKNIGIIAHIDAGKTTVTERVLFFTKKEYKIGEVHEGTAKMDWMEEEQERGITITAACTTVFWNDVCLNIVDTPGHVDFTAEVERSLRVLDGVVVVFSAVEGVEAQSETVWHQSDRYNIPKISFINKMDRLGADFNRTVDEIEQRFDIIPLPLQIPVFDGDTFTGMVDLLEEKAYRIPDIADFDNIEEIPVPEELEEECAFKREHIFEVLSEHDDEFCEAYLEGDGIDPDLIRKVIKKLTLENVISPVLCGSALKNKGVRFLLDAVVAYLPAVSDIESFEGMTPGSEDKITITADESAPFSALAFKVSHDVHGSLTYMRVYSGGFKPKKRIYNSTRDRIEKPSLIYRMHSSSRESIEEAVAGDIVAVVGLKFTITGDTLCTKDEPVLYEALHFPETVVSQSIEPATSSDEEKMDQVLTLIAQDDPTFTYRMDAETGQMLISGMGELHLEVITHRITKEYNLDVRVGNPNVSYRESITGEGVGEAEFQTQAGDTERYAYVKLRLDPAPKGSEFTMSNELVLPGFPPDFFEAVEEGVRDSLASGPILGYPVINCKAALVQVKMKSPQSDATAFRSAASMAFREAIQNGCPVLLEPFMKVVATAPEEYVGELINLFTSKRGEVVTSEVKGTLRIVEVLAPLKELFGFASIFRSATQGRGHFSMEPKEFRPLPEKLRKETSFF